MYEKDTALKFIEDRTWVINQELEKLVKNLHQYGKACGLDQKEMDEEINLIHKFRHDWSNKITCLKQFD